MPSRKAVVISVVAGTVFIGAAAAGAAIYAVNKKSESVAKSETIVDLLNKYRDWKIQNYIGDSHGNFVPNSDPPTVTPIALVKDITGKYVSNGTPVAAILNADNTLLFPDPESSSDSVLLVIESSNPPVIWMKHIQPSSGTWQKIAKFTPALSL